MRDNSNDPDNQRDRITLTIDPEAALALLNQTEWEADEMQVVRELARSVDEGAPLKTEVPA